MSDETPPPAPEVPEEQLAPYKIEPARSSRAKCKTCRRAIDKGVLRLGVLLEGPYGTGYLWHHLTCAAKRRFEDVEAAYGERAWEESVEVPALAELAALREKAAQAQKDKQAIPYAERAPTGRSKCKHCDEPIAEGAFRVVLGRGVEFGQQMRTSPINVHAACVAAELLAEDCVTEADGFDEALRANTRDLAAADVDLCLAEIGEV